VAPLAGGAADGSAISGACGPGRHRPQRGCTQRCLLPRRRVCVRMHGLPGCNMCRAVTGRRQVPRPSPATPCGL